MNTDINSDDNTSPPSRLRDKTLDEIEYMDDMNRFGKMFQFYSSNILERMHISNIRDYITDAYNSFPVGYNDISDKSTVTDTVVVDEVNKEIVKDINDDIKLYKEYTKIKTYECPRCMYKTPNKNRFIKHLNRKTPCCADFSDKSIDEIKKEYKLIEDIPKINKVILIDSAKYPEDVIKYNVCSHCNIEFTSKECASNHVCKVKSTLSKEEQLEQDNIKLIHIIKNLCTDITVLRQHHGILLKDNILGHKLNEQYDRIFMKHNIPFEYQPPPIIEEEVKGD